MANAYGKEVDTTFLSISGAVASRGFLHRDYLAHTLRYSHVAKFLNAKGLYKKGHVLDVGCGREVPLARLMFSMRMTHTTGTYTGVDYGPVKWPSTIKKGPKFKMKLIEKADFATVDLPRKKFDAISCLEVLEHVEAYHAFKMAQRMSSLLSKTGRAFISTPCYDPRAGAAANHVNEMSYEGFKALLEAAGLKVEKVWGTFASQRDYKKVMEKHYPGISAIFEELSNYYDSNVTSCLFAPLFPERSRNCIWELSSSKSKVLDKAELKELCKSHHGSSKKWSAQLRKIMKEA